MLFWLGSRFEVANILTSRMVLSGVGLFLTAFLVWILLPRLASRVPTDRGRDHSVDFQKSIGKPTGVGVIFVPLFLLVCAYVIPWQASLWPLWATLGGVFLAMVFGFLDDRSLRPWGEYTKGALDLVLSFAIACVICQLQPVSMWLPLVDGAVYVPVLVYLPLATGLLWVSINATNCTDGVDGLSGSLLMLAFLYLGGILYLVVGHVKMSAYLELPYQPLGPAWAIMSFALIGALGGYLWHNAHPSRMLMGDAGSRPLGLLLGVLVLVTGNPVLLLVVAWVVLVNGGTGLVKVALLRFFKIGIFRNVRFPLHDHCRKAWGWSDSQVLLRFILLQALVAPFLIVLLLKVF